MRVLIFSQYYPPEVGATQTRMHHFATALAARGHGVTVITEVPNHPRGIVAPGYGGRWVRRSMEDGVEVVRVWVYTSPRKTTIRRLLFYGTHMVSSIAAGLLAARRPYDVVFATSPPLPVAVAGYVAARAARCPLVMDIRDIWPAVGVSIGEIRGRPMIWAAERLERWLYAEAAAVTCVTRGFMVHVIAHGADQDKVAFLPNGTIPELFNPQRQDPLLRAQLGLEDRFVVAFCGNHGVAQGLPSVLEAARLLRAQDDVRFLFVGEGPVKADLLRAAERDGIENVAFLPQVPVDRVATYINAADVLLVPLRRDPLFATFIPSKLFDCMACAKPVIVTVPGEARAIVEESGAGVYVEPEDPAALASAVLALRGDPAQRTAMGQRGREYVLAHFLRDTQVARLDGILQDAVDGRAAGRAA